MHWLNIIRFHKDVMEKAAENVFALPVWRHDDIRWTCLDNDPIQELTGEWSIPVTSIRSTPFLQAVSGVQTQNIYIGGACYVESRRTHGGEGWIPEFWIPLVYKEVTIERQEDRLVVAPKETGWSISPQVLGRCGNINEDAAAVLQLAVAQLNDAIGDQGEGIPLAQRVRNVVFQDTEMVFPIGATINNGDVPQNVQRPTSWVLFCPPQQVGGVNIHLMRDYKNMEEQLDNGGSPGGMQILEGGHPLNVMPEVHNFMSPLPLTKSQRRAVAAVVNTDNPLTVISGPPGTGKSQVVAAILADCWKKGKSILFTSTNNTAVDVVKERVDDLFKFPMVVRSGNPGATNLPIDTVEKLTAMSDELARMNAADPLDQEAMNARLNALQNERSAYIDLLESEIPQRILEERQVARDAFEQYRKIHEELTTQTEGFRDGLTPLDPFKDSVETMQRTVEAHRQWIANYTVVFAPECDAAASKREQAERAIADSHSQLTDQLANLGCEPNSNEQTPVLQPTMTNDLFNWKSNLLDHIKEYERLVEKKPIWLAEFDRYTNASEARESHERLARLAEQIRTDCDRQTMDMAAAQSVEKNLDNALFQLETSSIPVKPYQRDTFSAWKECYVRFRQLSITVFDKMFFHLPVNQTKNLKLLRDLLSKEANLLDQLPAMFWPPALKKVDDIYSRDRLLPLVEKVLDYVRCLESHENQAQMRIGIQRRHREICENAGVVDIAALTLRDAPPDCEQYLAWAKMADFQADIAQRATVAWENRERTERVLGHLAEDLRSWVKLRNANPILAVNALLPSQTGQLLNVFLTETNGRTNDNLQAIKQTIQVVDAWNELRDRLVRLWTTYEAIRQDNEVLKGIPTHEKIQKRWFDEFPEDVKRLWPPFDLSRPVDADAWSAKLNALQQNVDTYAEFYQGERQGRLDEAEGHKNEALERLHELVIKVPDEQLRNKVRVAIELELEHGTNPDVPLDAMLTTLDPQAIGNKLRDCDRQILEIWLEMAKREWHQRCREMNTGESLTALTHAYQGVRNGFLDPAHYDAFRQALPTATCWVSSALSSMSIPRLPSLFDIVMIDEASQCTITNILPFLYRAKRVVVIGDKWQLPPIPSITESQEEELAQKHELTDFEAQRFAHHGANEWSVYAAGEAALPCGGSAVLMLLDHFRCQPSIISFSNRHIYRKALNLRKYPTDQATLPCAPGINVVDVPDGFANKGAGGKSWVNQIEAQAVVETLRKMLTNANGTKEIGVITAFKGQAMLLQSLLHAEANDHSILIDTVHAFQGNERDIIIYSPTVSENMPNGTRDFVDAEPNLINVAVTRAKEAFCFVGNVEFCKSLNGYLGKLASYCEEIQTMRDGGSPAEVELYGWMMMREWADHVRSQWMIPGVDQSLDFFISINGRQVSIEVDGAVAHHGRQGTDQARDAVLRAIGIIPLRFSAEKVMKMPFNVIKQIEDAINTQ